MRHRKLFSVADSQRFCLCAAQIAEDPLSQIAEANWSATAVGRAKPPPFKPKLVLDIYKKHLGGASEKAPGLKRTMLLELSQYLENYLWPHFAEAGASYEHIMSIVLIVNEKFRENVPAWTCFGTRQVCTMHSRKLWPLSPYESSRHALCQQPPALHRLTLYCSRLLLLVCSDTRMIALRHPPTAHRLIWKSSLS